MPAEDGETCVVCYGRCTRDDAAYLVDGKRCRHYEASRSRSSLKDRTNTLPRIGRTPCSSAGPTAIATADAV